MLCHRASFEEGCLTLHLTYCMFLNMQNFNDIINLWPSRAAFERDLELPKNLVHMWAMRDTIPPEYWAELVDAAEKRSIEGVTLSVLAALRKNQSG